MAGAMQDITALRDSRKALQSGLSGQPAGGLDCASLADGVFLEVNDKVRSFLRLDPR
jgi:hypothetical protein